MPRMDIMKHNFTLRWFTLLRVPVIAYLRPKIVELNDERCEVIIPHGHRSRNHLNVMYFGVLCVGADLAGGTYAIHLIRHCNRKISIVFKDFHAEFMKKAKCDVRFVCTQNKDVKALLDAAMETTERLDKTIDVIAVPANGDPSDILAKFKLTMSMQVKD